MRPDKTPIKAKINIVDNYLSFEHRLYKGVECEATPNYTSTKKLKGYLVKNKKNERWIHMKIDELEFLAAPPTARENEG